MASELLQGFRLGSWTVEPLQGVVSGPNGETQHLEPKVMDVFVCLAEHANELVSRDQLLDVAWNSNVPCDEQLTRAISEIRRAFYDDAQHPKFIETVPKRGYRLLQEVRLPEPSERPKPRGVMHYFMAAALLVIGAGMIAWWQPWQVRAEPASLERMAFPLPDKPSIAVLPFTNLSDDPRQEYFTDGMTNDIITDLSKFRDLLVIASNSTFTYKGKPVKVQQVAEELGVRYVLEGSVQKEGEQVRVNAQFIDAITGKHLWAERYDRELSDIFAMQDEITQKIVAILGSYHGILADADRARARRKGTSNLSAYELFLLALELSHHFTKEDVAKSIELYAKAIELDPQYARAYAGLAMAHWQDWFYGWAESPEHSATQFVDAAKTAVEVDETEPEAHWALAMAYMTILKRYQQGAAEYELAIALNPNNADLLASWGWDMSTTLGRAEEGVKIIKKAMRLNPYYPDWYEEGLGIAAYYARQYEEAVSAFNKVQYRVVSVHLLLAASYARLGRLEEAHAEAANVLELQPDFSIKAWQEKVLSLNPADMEHYLDGLRKAGLPE